MSVSPIIASLQNMLELVATGSDARDKENQELRDRVASLEIQLKRSKRLELTYTRKFRMLKMDFHAIQKENLKMKLRRAKKRKHQTTTEQSEKKIKSEDEDVENKEVADN